MTDIFFNTSPAGYFSFYDNGCIYVINQTACDALCYEKVELEDLLPDPFLSYGKDAWPC